jgi:branched-chain amino acid transport system permease protein
MTLFLIAVVSGLGVGSVYGLLALSYTIVYRSTGIFNVAQGDLMMTGVLVSYFALVEWHLSQFVALPIIIVAVIAVSLIEERIAVRPFLTGVGAQGFGWFISTLGFSLLLETGAFILYKQPTVVPIPAVVGENAIHLGSFYIAPKFVLAFVVMIVIAVLLEVFYKKTWLGIAMRGIAEDREVSALRGIDVRRISRLAFVIAGLVTGIAAFVVAPITAADTTIGFIYGLNAFIALAVGGFGNLRGCVVGGLLLGVIEQLFDLYVNPSFEVLAGLGLILLVLAVRPSGLFKSGSVRHV